MLLELEPVRDPGDAVGEDLNTVRLCDEFISVHRCNLVQLTYHDGSIGEPRRQAAIELNAHCPVLRAVDVAEHSHYRLVVALLDFVGRDAVREDEQEMSAGCEDVVCEGLSVERNRVVDVLDGLAACELRNLGENGLVGERAVDNVRRANGLQVFLVLQGRSSDHGRIAGELSELNGWNIT